MTGRVEGTVRLWQQPDGWWRWRWSDGATELVSNEAYPEVAEARSSARTAFPLAPLVDPTREAGPAGVPAPVRRPVGRLLLAAVGVVVLMWASGAWPRRRGVPG